MSWSLGSIIIHPDSGEDVESYESYYAIQEVLDNTVDTISFYGASSQRRSLQFILDEDENSNTGKSTLKTAIRADSSCNLTSDQGSQGNYRILSMKFTRIQALNHTNPVYKVSAELISESG